MPDRRCFAGAPDALLLQSWASRVEMYAHVLIVSTIPAALPSAKHAAAPHLVIVDARGH